VKTNLFFKHCIVISGTFALVSVLIIVASLGIAHGNPIIGEALFLLIRPAELLYPLFGFDGDFTYAYLYVFVVQFLCAWVPCGLIRYIYHHYSRTKDGNVSA
jgi:hypothetical protein